MHCRSQGDLALLPGQGVPATHSAVPALAMWCSLLCPCWLCGAARCATQPAMPALLLLLRLASRDHCCVHGELFLCKEDPPGMRGESSRHWGRQARAGAGAVQMHQPSHLLCLPGCPWHHAPVCPGAFYQIAERKTYRAASSKTITATQCPQEQEVPGVPSPVCPVAEHPDLLGKPTASSVAITR